MKPFRTLTAIAAPIDIPKVDTGMIISARFTRRPRGGGHPDYSSVFLHDVRFDERGEPRADFVLNMREHQGAKILVTGPDFGCGSSREGAAYAVLDYGIRALVGSSFGEIFAGNCMRNGILPVVLPPATVRHLMDQITVVPGALMTVDLEQQSVTGPDGAHYGFSLDLTRKKRMLKGLDDVGAALEFRADIETFEENYRDEMSWSFVFRPARGG